MNQSSTYLVPPDVNYPDSDGLPMSDNTRQFNYIVLIKEGYEAQYRDREDVFVAGDLLWYPVEGNNTIRTAPDTMVVFGRPKGHRGSYMQWREAGVTPQVVWEILSPGNRAADLQAKFNFYERYGVEEYYRYDPDRGILRGWLREGDELREIDTMQGWTSPRTDVRMELVGTDLVLYHPDGEPFRTLAQEAELREEEQRAREAAQARAERERREREAAQAREEQERREREAAQARAERERLEREAAQAREEQERREREAANARAEQERREREAAQACEEQERREREAARAREEHERREREAAQARAEKLAEQLRALGIEPEA